MNTDHYKHLAQALDLLPNGFPRTKSGIELSILNRIFSPKEAQVACKLTGTSVTMDAIAERIDISREEIEELLGTMLEKSIIWGSKRNGIQRYRLAPFIVGFYEKQWDTLDHELAHLVEQYFSEGGLEGLMRPVPAIFRVVPAQQALKTESILPYDDIKPLLLQAKHFVLRDCICRKQQVLLGSKKCDFPLNLCLSFSMVENPPGPHDINREEALGILDQAEEIGLVHSVSNVVRGIYFICNCCGCCCNILRGITQFGIENSLAKANYTAVVDLDLCDSCGICEDRCQVKACSMANVSVIDSTKCIGCGLCVTGCPIKAVTLKLRPDAEIITPPRNYKTWEQNRLQNRGITRGLKGASPL